MKRFLLFTMLLMASCSPAVSEQTNDAASAADAALDAAQGDRRPPTQQRRDVVTDAVSPCVELAKHPEELAAMNLTAEEALGGAGNVHEPGCE